MNEICWNVGILENWNIGLKIGNGLYLKFNMRCHPIKKNPFIPGPDRLCKNVCDNTFIYAEE
jgi:hypothetical protein